MRYLVRKNDIGKNSGLYRKSILLNMTVAVFVTMLCLGNLAMAQGKLVSVSMGARFDVAVDIRNGSPFFGMWYGTVLSLENRLMLWVPPGFAHGFMSLDDCLVMNYKFTNEYSSEHEGGIIWNDPQIAIDWPVVDPILSEKDSMLPRLSEIDSPFVYQPV